MPPLSHLNEFPAGASEWPPGLNRRQFLERMGASLALAGLGACNRPPEKTIVPYVVPPNRDLLDAAAYYATVLPWEGFGRGVLALSHSGRPTKIEGNPAHPDSLGATDLFMQAAVLSLYDPDRSQAPRRRGTICGSAEFEDYWLQEHRQLSDSHGARFAILTPPTTSPTLLRTIHALLDRLPEARWFQHSALPRYDRNGEQDDYDFAKADVILAIDDDFLSSHPSSLRYARAFAGRRRSERGHVNANRLYVIEPAPSITGSMADHRLPISPRRVPTLLTAIDATLGGSAPPAELADAERRFVAMVAADLRERAPGVVCTAGAHCADIVQSAIARLNERLGANGFTRHALPAVRSDGDARCAGDLAVLVRAMATGRINTLAIMGANPAYTAPRDLLFTEALKRVPHTIHLGSHVDETGALCEWHIPESHPLEAWSDLRSYDGTATILQPLIAPMYESRTATQFVHLLAEPPGRSDYDLVRETWQKTVSGDDSDAGFATWLNQGLIDGTAHQRTPPRKAGVSQSVSTPASRALSVVIRPDPHVRDGEWTNNAWLQELPRPATQLVWDNPALIAPALAEQHHLESGDVVTLETLFGALDVPVCVTPGVSPDCIILHLGYGRTHAGRVGTGVGVDAYRLRHSREPWMTELVSVTRTGRRTVLVSTHDHFSMEGRDLVRTVAASAAGRTARGKPERQPTLYPDWKYEGYRWGMLIDLATCIGCKACVIACQAENNTPVVGKEQVARGREMHWLRVDQYYTGDPANPQVLHQPVPCMQCENAPCEVVCPVAATVHSSEGLNDMVYNRCIGTRYCSNNCPYKVRRFNFLDYRGPRGSTVNLQKNPEVSVRARGVMEKCTYCVQRIDSARISAERENRRIRDGEIRTACQQACPTEAIVFGDLNDPASRVRTRKAEPTNYVLLEELNTQPRTTYLAKITNRREDA